MSPGRLISVKRTSTGSQRSALSASAAVLTACTQKPCSDSACVTHSLMRNSSSTNSTWTVRFQLCWMSWQQPHSSDSERRSSGALVPWSNAAARKAFNVSENRSDLSLCAWLIRGRTGQAARPLEPEAPGRLNQISWRAASPHSSTSRRKCCSRPIPAAFSPWPRAPTTRRSIGSSRNAAASSRSTVFTCRTGWRAPCAPTVSPSLVDRDFDAVIDRLRAAGARPHADLDQ